MAAASPPDDQEIVGINVTPLVDITLVLLIIFMVTARLISQQGIPMDLPRAATGGTTQTVFTVSVDAEGHLFANGSPIDAADLGPAAAAALHTNPELRTVVQAAGSARHEAVLGAVDALRAGGVFKIAFASEPPTPGPRAEQMP